MKGCAWLEEILDLFSGGVENIDQGLIAFMEAFKDCFEQSVHPFMARYESELQVAQLFKRAIIRTKAICSRLFSSGVVDTCHHYSP